jgi:hypothetical protein
MLALSCKCLEMSWGEWGLAGTFGKMPEGSELPKGKFPRKNSDANQSKDCGPTNHQPYLTPLKMRIAELFGLPWYRQLIIDAQSSRCWIWLMIGVDCLLMLMIVGYVGYM